jgi:hypothetical protein
MPWKWLNRLRFNGKQPGDARDGGSRFSIADTGNSLARDDKRPIADACKTGIKKGRRISAAL